MALPLSRLGYEDYLRMPDNGHRYEIINGELFVSPSRSIKHQTVSVTLASILLTYVRLRRLGMVLCAPCTVRLTPDEPVEPDLLFVRRDRISIVSKNSVDGAPDLIVEILSPSNAPYDRVTKFNRYLQLGVPEYWIIDPVAETIEQFVLESGQYLRLEPSEEGFIGSRVIDGLRIAVAEIFDDAI